MSLKHEIRFEPGYDCIRNECCHGSKSCVPNGGGSHGLHGMTVSFYATGDKGVVQFKLCLADMIPGRIRHGGFESRSLLIPSILAWDLGYHSPVPMYEDQSETSNSCEFLGDVPCYYDGSGLNAEIPLEILSEFGDEVLWAYLDQYYLSVFEDGKFPNQPETKLISRKEVPAKI